MSELPQIPAKWKWSTMGDVAEVIGGGTPKTDQAEYFGGDISWITPADLSGYTEKFISRGSRNITKTGLENSGARLMPAGAVLFSSRAPIGYVAIAANPVSTNQGFKSFVLRGDLTPDFVYYYLQHAKKLAVELASGTTFLEISGKKAAQIPIPVPQISEQKKIVGEIEKQFTRLEAGVAALRRVQANLKRYRAAVLKAACEGRLVPTEANQWRQVALEEVCSKITDGEHQTPKRQATGKMLLSAKNVRDGFIDYRDHDLISESDFQKCCTRCDAKPNDILIVCVGATIGRTAIVREKTEFALVRSVALLRPEKISPKYLLYAIQSDIGQKQIASVKRGSAQACLYLHRIRKITIPLPPLAEQTRIVAEVERRLSVVEELESVVTANLQRATRLRQSIFQKAFTGGLA